MNLPQIMMNISLVRQGVTAYPSAMKRDDAAEKGWRGSREGWLEVGYQALIDGGVDAVKILPLAKRLNLARTSFYWFFEDREALLAALIDGWEQRTTKPLVDATSRYAETVSEAMLNVLTCFLAANTFDSRLEFAVRSWALQDEGVADRVKAADEARLQAIAAMLVKWGNHPDEADIRARTVYLVQIGYISMQAREDIETRLARIPMYVRIYTGQDPEPREIARFNAGIRQGQG